MPLRARANFQSDSTMSSSASLESQLAKAVDEGKVPQAVVYAATKDGNFEYSHAVGKTSMEDGVADVKDDAVFLLASQTKLMTAVAALQVVERGLIGFDDSVEKLLPELAEQQVLKGFGDDDKPILEQRKTPILFRHILTHTAGTAYDAGNADLIKYQSQLGVTPNSGTDVVSRFSYPLIFQPGEAWSYGSAMDWTGLVVERLTGQTLEEYMKANIWDPLGMQTTTFFPARKEGVEARVPTLSVRGPDGKSYPFNSPFINTGSTGCFGGHGGYSAMDDYIKFLRSILANDGKLLSHESLELLFKPQLSPTLTQSLKDYLLSPSGAFFIGEFEAEKYEHSWAFGGVVFVQGYDDGRRNAGSLSWGGVANSFWLVDREAELVITFGTQLIPPGDAKVKEVISVVEKQVYKLAGIA